MATSIVPVSTSKILSHPFRSLTVSFGAWKERRRQRAGAALLMRLEPQMLKDIGVILVEQRGGALAMLKWHPTVLATTMQPPDQSRSQEW